MLNHKLVLSLLVLIFLLAACQEETPAPTATAVPPTEETEAEEETETAVEPTEESSEPEAEAEMTDGDAPIIGPGVIWNWASVTDPVDGKTVIDPDLPYTFSLVDDTQVVMGTSCRAGIGEYTLEDNALTLTFDIPEKYDEDCEEDEFGERYFELMQNAALYFIEDGRLYIDLMADGGTLAFDLGQVIDMSSFEEEETVTAVSLCGDDALTLNEIENTFDPEQSALLDEAITTMVSEGGIFSPPAPGVSLFVTTPDGTYFKSVGVADIENCEPLPADALFEIGSNTKMMTSAIIYQLQEEGVLSTSDLITEWIPEVAALVPNSEEMTIDMLLTHTNGIYDYLNGVAEDGPLAAGIEDKDVLTAAYTPEEIIELAMASGEPYFEPGADGQWEYSNTGYILLGLIIEAATDKSYEENLQERIFEPLSLDNTILLDGQPELGMLPQGYYQAPFDYTTGEWNATQAWSAGAVVSTAEDMATFMKALFSGELYQDPATLDMMITPGQPDFELFSDSFYYGHGMFYKQGVFGHGGQALGYQSDGGYIPDEDATIVVWANSAENPVGQAGPTIAMLLGLVDTPVQPEE